MLKLRMNASFICALFLLCLFYCMAVFSFDLTGDSIEHINTTWLISQGLVPYRDFFQHHHPLLWYMMLPIVKFFENANSAHIITFYKAVSVVNTGFCAFILYKICKEYVKNSYVALLSVLLFLSSTTIFVFSLVLRPDNFMILFSLWGFYFLIKYRETTDIKHLYLSSSLFFISFMFLQKIIFLFIAIAVFLQEDIQNKKLKWTPFIKVCLCFVGVFVAFLFGLYEIQSLVPYFYYNFLFNLQINAGQYYIPDFQEWLYILTGLISCVYVIKKEKNENLVFISKVALFFFLITLITGIPQSYYLVLPIALFLPSMSCTLSILYRNLSFYYKCILHLGGLVFLLYFSIDIIWSYFDEKKVYTSFDKIQYVLDNVPKNETIFNGDINRISLFHKNVHYFRHNLTLNPIKSKDFNWGLSYDEIRTLIKEKKPYLIIDSWPIQKELITKDTSSNAGFSLKLDDEILEMYEKEPEFGFYIRKK